LLLHLEAGDRHALSIVVSVIEIVHAIVTPRTSIFNLKLVPTVTNVVFVVVVIVVNTQL